MSQVRSLWQKIQDRLRALQRSHKKIEPMLKAKEKADQIAGLFDQVLETHHTGRLASSNDDVNKLYTLGNKLANHLGRFARQSPNYWMEHSGANLFSAADTTEGLKRLVAVREELDAMQSAAEGLANLTKLLTVKDYADVKGVASALTTATLADLEARKETARTFELCVHHIEGIRANLVIAIEAVRDLQNSLHTFIVQKSNNRRFQDALNQHSRFFKPGPVDALTVNPWKKSATTGRIP